MLRKLFKSVLIFSLCVGTTLTSNAAVSVSDGSAFVTKSEFEADVNNLSNRMAQLENSLDAKIDSLVSSYLTRNGIWNGAKQDIKTGGFVVNIAGSGQEPIYAMHNPPNFTSSSSFSWNFADNIRGDALFFTANKSGLLAMSLSTYGEYNTSTKTFDSDFRSIFAYIIYAAGTTTPANIGTSSTGMYAGWELYDKNTGVVKTSVSLGNIVPTEVTNGTDTLGYRQFLFTYNGIFKVVQCFLAKDDVIWQRVRFKLNIGGSSSIRFNDGRATTVKAYNIVINYCDIY